MKGKIKCEALKKIRKDIAKANGIKLEIPECTHTGDCLGTCPRCESEVRYLERTLDARRKRGFKIALAGVSAGLVAVSATSCDWLEPRYTAGGLEVLDGDIPAVTDIFDETGSICESGTEELVSITAPGSLAIPPEELSGELADTEEYVLEGDIAFVPEIAGGIGPMLDEETWDSAETMMEMTGEESDTQTAEDLE